MSREFNPSQWLFPELSKLNAYSIDKTPAKIKLDQNESPFDWPQELKDEILKTLSTISWNRYPEPFIETLNEAIASYAGVQSNQILTGPGSNYLITLLLSAFAKGSKEPILIASPSFPLYESHCRSEGIPYVAWSLNHDFEYDISTLPSSKNPRVLIFASPNNPVGNTLSIEKLRDILTTHKDLLVIADEAYVEYSDAPYTDLLKEFPQLILIRTFSKTLSAAAIRLGYLIAHPKMIAELKKLRLPYLLNVFTSVACVSILQSKAYLEGFQKNVSMIKSERERVFLFLSKHKAKYHLECKASQANFLLLRWKSSSEAEAFYKHLLEQKVLLRNLNAHPGMAGCLRLSIGTASDNDAFMSAVETFKGFP